MNRLLPLALAVGAAITLTACTTTSPDAPTPTGASSSKPAPVVTESTIKTTGVGGIVLSPSGVQEIPAESPNRKPGEPG